MASDGILQGLKVRFLDDGTAVPYSIPLQFSQSLALPTLNAIAIDSAAVAPAGRGVKTAILQVTTALTWVSSGQASIRAYTSIAGIANGAGGATTQLPAGTTQLLGAAVTNLGAAAQTTLPVGIYSFSPAAITELQWFHPNLGFEMIFPSALTGGVATLTLYSASH